MLVVNFVDLPHDLTLFLLFFYQEKRLYRNKRERMTEEEKNNAERYFRHGEKQAISAGLSWCCCSHGRRQRVLLEWPFLALSGDRKQH